MIRHYHKDTHASIAEREAFLHRINDTLPPRSILISTCDRVELYADDEGAGYMCDADIARHLFRVVSGLESPFLGEHQIFHQVKQAYHASLTSRRSSPALNVLFQTALNVGKIVRTRTAIARGALSHAQAAATIIRRELASYAGVRVTFIGVNDMVESMIRYLLRYGITRPRIVNRTYDKALALASRYAGSAFPLSALPEALQETDVVIAATSAPKSIIHADDIPKHPLLIVDLGMPRNVDPAVVRDGIRLFTLSDVERITRSNWDARVAAVKEAECIIEQKTEAFIERLNTRETADNERRQLYCSAV
ncbi:MAG: NAD(P)-binding domain-containing protein [Spirochaetes bacterium]|nr:NAD(P)-binding domain-containing protein [Spirochaetota bacterium]